MPPRSTIQASRPTKSQMTQPSASSAKRKALPKKEISLGDRVQRLNEAAHLLDGIKQRPEQSRGALHLGAQLVRSVFGCKHNLSSSSRRTTDKAIIRAPSTCITSFSTAL